MTRRRCAWLLISVLFLSVSCVSYLFEPTPVPEILSIDNVRQIVPPPQGLGVGRLFWSPDSTQLVFTYARTSMDNSPSKYQILTVDIHSEETRLIEESSNNRDVRAWLPDKRIAIFASGDLREGIWLIELNANGSKEFFNDSSLAIWSPDGRQFAFEKFERGSQTNTISIFVHNMVDGDQQEIIKTQVKGFGLELLQWSPDGENILLTLDDNATLQDSLYSLDLVTKEIRQLTDNGYHSSASWSPDGAFIIYTYRRTLDVGDHVMLYIMRSDGSCPTLLIPPSGHDIGWAMWSPDGRWIALTWNNGIYLLDTLQIAEIELLKNGSSCP